MPSDRAPISPRGWKMVLYFYDDRLPMLFMTRDPNKGFALTYCQRIKALWHDDKHRGDSELVIMPVDGWESIKADTFGAIAWAIKSDLVSIEIGAALIRAIAEEVADRHPAEGLLGLAIYYLRAMSGGDDDIESLIDKLNKNLHRRVGDVDAPMPF